MEDFMEALDAFNEVFKQPCHIVQKTLDHRWIFAINHFPSEVRSDEEPPVRLGEHVDTIPICGVLGLYNPDTQEITIFRKGINRVAQILGCEAAHLTMIVRVHEWSHALLHIGLEERELLEVTRDDSLWPDRLTEATAWFKWLDSELHERLAQLLTYYGLRSVESEATLARAKSTLARVVTAFGDLARRQPAEYQIGQYVSLPKRRLLCSIDLLKNRRLVGTPAWHTVITW
jgi:hypothetical protein